MKKCPQCSRAGSDLDWPCGNHRTCPIPHGGAVDVAPNDVVIRCDVCDVTRVISAPMALQGRTIQASYGCQRALANCQAMPQLPAHEAPAPKGRRGAQKSDD